MSNNIGFWTRKLEENERKILPENFRLLRRHVRKLLAGNVRERTVVNHIQLLLPFAMWCEIDYKSLDEDDIFDYCDHLMEKTYTRGCQPKRYSSSTVYAHKTCVKTFLKNINPSASDAIVLKKSKREIPEILTKDDVLAMINASLTARDRALVSCLFESGARKGELLSVRIKHVNFDENGAVVILPQGKTGPRRIRLVFSASYLREWISVHPAGDRESIVFCALREPFPAISDTGLHYQLRKLAKRAGVKKRVNAHGFRHASATYLAKHLTEQELKAYLGWTASSSMAATYVHLAGEDIDGSILQMNGLRPANSDDCNLRVSRCPRCKELQPSESIFCNKCGLPLGDSAKTKIEIDAAEISIEVMKAVLLNPDILEEISRRVNAPK